MLVDNNADLGFMCIRNSIGSALGDSRVSTSTISRQTGSHSIIARFEKSKTEELSPALQGVRTGLGQALWRKPEASNINCGVAR
jgi:hypothetical protein